MEFILREGGCDKCVLCVDSERVLPSCFPEGGEGGREEGGGSTNKRGYACSPLRGGRWEGGRLACAYYAKR